jgi:D-alanyl-D-alanine carboxypeptidase (penicillin-binding protein 5/6)
MNDKAAGLGMQNTHFINTNGLNDGDDEGYSSARDVAIMSRELMKHRDVTKYTTIWMDSLRNGEFGLANTNKLIRFYSGATGIKTGSTKAAGYCLSASAMRDNMELIAVVLGADTTENRFANATSLLDFGFATYSVISLNETDEVGVQVEKGKAEELLLVPHGATGIVVPKAKANKLEKVITAPDKLQARIKKGEKFGEISFVLDGEVLGTADLVAQDEVKKMNIFEWIGKILKRYIV